MSAPTDFELFAFYHLGLDREWNYRFRNIGHAARYFNHSVPQIQQLLNDYQIDAETVTAVPYALSAAHAEVQILSMSASKADVEAFARRTFADFVEARKQQKPGSGLLHDRDFEIQDKTIH